MCAWCLRQFPFDNPFEDKSPWHSMPHCPWAGGTLSAPRGKGCKPCLGSWVCGGWREEYGTPEKFAAEAKKDHVLMGEWEKSRQLFIQLSNMGEAPAQLRQCTTEGLSRKNNKWQKKLVEFRKNRRRLLKRSGHLTSIKTKLKVLTKKRYKELHKNRSPERDGVKMKSRRIDGELVETCLARVNPDGEWDMSDGSFEEVAEEEELDNGKHILREGILLRKRKHSCNHTGKR